MSRWEPNARGRLAHAAFELYGERGYEQTTIEDIATRAGVTKRTFFRHFADKREVLFDGGDAFRQRFLDGLAGAPADAAPLEAAAASIDAVASWFADRHALARHRQAIIDGSIELQERELVKLASVATALAGGLRERGVAEPTATVTAETALAIFRTAFERWVGSDDGGGRDLAAHVRESFDALRAAATA